MDINLQVGVKIFLKNAAGQCLLVKRSAQKYPGARGSWDIVGGRIDPGSKLLDNLRREVDEEVKLQIIGEPVLLFAQDIMPSPDRHIVRLSYLGQAEGDPILDKSENTDYQWLSVAEIKNLGDLDIYVREIVESGLLD